MISQSLLLPNVSAICCSPILAFLIISFYNFIFLSSLNNIQVCYIESAMNLHPFFNFFIRSFILRTYSTYLIKINLYLDMVISFLGTEEAHSQRFGLTVSFRRCPSSFYESYPMGGASTSTSLKYQLVQAVILPRYGAFVDSKGSGNLLRISCVLLTNLHTPHVLRAFFYTNRRKGVKMIFK